MRSEYSFQTWKHNHIEAMYFLFIEIFFMDIVFLEQNDFKFFHETVISFSTQLK